MGTPERDGGIHERLLRNPHRRAIVRQLLETPGLNKNQLRQKLSLLPRTLHGHLGRLEEHGIIITRPSAQDQETLCFVAEDDHLADDEDTLILYGRYPTRHIALYIAENPGTTTRSIAKALDKKKTTIRYHLRTLRDEHDLIRDLRADHQVRYYPRQPLTEWYDALGDAYDVPWEPQSPDR